MPHKDPVQAKTYQRNYYENNKDKSFQNTRKRRNLMQERLEADPFDPTCAKYVANSLRGNWNRQGIKFESEAEQQAWIDKALSPDTICAVTGMTNAESVSKLGRRLSLDHDHISGKPRRFVTHFVNTILGFLETTTPEQITNLLRLHEEDRRTRDDIA